MQRNNKRRIKKMKKYEEFELTLIAVSAQDIITMSGFDGEVDDDGFGDPNFAK